MAKFSQVSKGICARERGVKFTALDGTECIVDLRILTGTDDDLILEAAAAHARTKNETAKRGEPIYDFACNCELVARATVDQDSPDESPQPFFESSDQVRAALDRDRIQYLAARQHAFQERTSPLKHSLTTDEYTKKIMELVSAEEGDDTPFVEFAPSLLKELARTMAKQLWIVLQHRLQPGGNSPTADSKKTETGSESSTTSTQVSER